MDFGSINWLAVLVCVIVSMISGFVWYSPKTLYPVWWKSIGRSPSDQPGMDNMGVVWGLTVLAALVEAVSVTFMLPVMGANTAGSGAMVGVMLWLGFVAPTSLVNKLFGRFSMTSWLIEAGNHLLNFILFGAILGAWR